MTKTNTDHRRMAGHRQRLRDKFLKNGLDSFADYEIVELLLTLGTPRKDCKAMAKAAIKQFKGLHGVLDATLEELQSIKGIGPSNAFGIKLFQAVALRHTQEQLTQPQSFNSPSAVAQFLQKKIGSEKKEHFLMLALDTRNRLIAPITISVGSLSASIVHPREVFKEAYKLSAAKIILSHNHPSGDPQPSSEDITLTQQLIQAGELLGIPILDHLIVTRTDYLSLKTAGLL